jgi:hypothetical protein
MGIPHKDQPVGLRPDILSQPAVAIKISLRSRASRFAYLPAGNLDGFAVMSADSLDTTTKTSRREGFPLMNWIDDFFETAAAVKVCTRIHCTTCGSLPASG